MSFWAIRSMLSKRRFPDDCPRQWHQLRADRGEILGFLCLVNHDRDIPKYPTEEDLAGIRKNPEAAAFLDGTLKD